MSGVSAYLTKATLDWLLRGATPTDPANRWVGLAAGVPSYTSGSEMGTLTGYARKTASFGAAASPAGSASNTNALTFGPFSSDGSVVGVHIWDGSPAGSSNMMYFAALAAPEIFGPGDQIVFAPGALNIQISGLTSYLEKAVLDWSLGGATPTRPPGAWLGYATGVPNDNGDSNVPMTYAVGGTRRTVTFAAANSPQGSATNLNAILGTFTGATATITGWNLYDSSGAGIRRLYGTMSGFSVINSADRINLAAGSLKITMA